MLEDVFNPTSWGPHPVHPSRVPLLVCPTPSCIPQGGEGGRAAPLGGAALSVWPLLGLTRLPALASVEYEDELLRKTVPAAHRRPARGESQHCSSSGDSRPAQGLE